MARGKVVLIHDETPQNQWKNGLVDSVTLKTAKGNLIPRPMKKLCSLKCEPRKVSYKTLKINLRTLKK